MEGLNAADFIPTTSMCCCVAVLLYNMYQVWIRLVKFVHGVTVGEVSF